MKRHIHLLLLTLLVAPLAFTSCMDDDDEVDYSEGCYISSFSLGSLHRKIYGTTSEGEDSIYTTTFSGSTFVMSINQRNLTIENLDSLPIRTQLDKVTTSAVFEGALVWRKADISNLEDTTWTTYNSSDSLDLTEPIHLRVFSVTGLSSRTYTLKVNVHQQRGDSTTWDSLGTVAAMKGMQARKTIVWDGKIVVLGQNTEDALTYIEHPIGTQGEWIARPTTGTTNANIGTIQTQGDHLYMSTADGQVIESTNGIEWTTSAYPALSGLRLVAASEAYLYALANGYLYRSNGGEWELETLDDEASLLPSLQIGSVYYAMKNGRPRLMLIGARGSDDTKATIWVKSWETGAEERTAWMYYTPNQADKYRLPMLESLCVVPYDDGLQALGGKSPDGRYAAMDSIFHSQDHGITWKAYEDNDMDVDPRLHTVAQGAQHIVATVDEEHFLWVFVDDQVWRGRINRLGFVRK